MTDFGLQEHGKRMSIDSSHPKINECLVRIVKLQDEANSYIVALMLLIIMNSKFTIPCQKCLKDAALLYIDLGNAMNELVDLCENEGIHK